jgi:putative heme-binding domain-containing protein
LRDASRAPPKVAEAPARRAAIEPDAEARSQLACSARRLPARDALPIVRALLARTGDERDIHIQLLIWWAIESKVAADPELVLAMFSDSEIWGLPIVKTTLIERLMRRFAAAGTRGDLIRCARLLALAPGPEHVKRLMTGFELAYSGRSLAGIPPELVDALAHYSKESITLGLRRGKPEAVSETLRVLADPSADRTRQLQLLQTLGEVRLESAVPAMLRLGCESSDNALRSAALTALAGYDHPAIATEVIRVYANMPDDVQAAAQNLLAARRASAARFLKAIEAGTIDSHGVSPEIVEKLMLLGDPAITDPVTRIWGAVKPASSAELHARIDRLAAVIRDGSGIPKPGKKIFEQQCARCHTLFGQGGKVGPDLTTYRRDDLDAMLLNIVNPSAEIREGYAASVLAVTDGRILSGVIVEEDKNVIVVRGADGHEATLPRDAIDTMRPNTKSLMPEGLLNEMSAQQIRDLFAYLRSTQPLID